MVLAKNLYEQLGVFSRQEPIVALGLIDNVLKSLVLAYLYPIGYKGGSPVKEGFRFGILTGVLVGSSWVLGVGATQPVTSLSTWVAVESAFVLIQFGLAGIVIGLIYGRGQKSSA
ncbi:MAG: DUF1761 domain-containing protein [Gammaproteobacteria bacterium]|nr:DUF1761 domain-containing protein [Gammaproteobacteria bacterium]